MCLILIVGSVVSIKFDVVYNLFFEYSYYFIVYSEGFNFLRCFNGREIVNLYSLCNNFLNICDIIIRVFGMSIMFIILFIWRLRYIIELSIEELEWDVLDFVINFFIVVKVKLWYFLL